MSINQLFKQGLPTPDQMHTLVKFVEEGSLSKAFGGGKSAQASATQQLSRIDQCLGIRTRKKSGSYKIPTDAAKEMAEFCREFFQKLDDFKKRSERKPNSFVVGAGDSLMFYLLIPALKKMSGWSRSIELHLENLRSQEIVAGLLNGSVDIGLVRASAVKRELVRRRRLHVEPICQIDYAFFVKKDLLKSSSANTTTDRALLTWAAQNCSLASFWGEVSEFTAILSKISLKWPVQLYCQSFPQVREAVMFGGFCGILPTIAFGDVVPDDIQIFGRSSLMPASRKIELAWSSTLTERRQGGEALVKRLGEALKRN